MMRKKFTPVAAMLAVGLMGVAACNTMVPGPGDDMMDDPATLRLSLEGLEALGAGYVYEGWLIVDGAPVSTGRFSINAMGTLSQSEFEVDADDAAGATTFVLTIEPEQNDPPEPADTHVLAGDFMASAADLTIGHGAALGDSFDAAAGTFILNTPSTADTDDDFDQGIWWLAIDDGAMVMSLDLPTLPAGWAYEGWVVGDDGPVSTGRFTDVAAADDDGAGATSGPDGFPPFPGQDFIDPAMVLIGHAAVISVEPEPDDSAGPFALKPLVDMNIEDVSIGVSQMMANMSANNPHGMAELIAP